MSAPCPPIPLTPTHQTALARLRAQLYDQEHRFRPLSPGAADHEFRDAPLFAELLPERRWPRAGFVEWLAPTIGSGADLLACQFAAAVCRPPASGSTPRALVVVDPRGEFYPPAAAALGIDLRQLVLVRPRSSDDAAWAIDQALRTPGVGAVLSWADRMHPHTLRRWQLAAEQHATLGIFVRSATARDEPCWALVRWLVTPVAWAHDPAANVAQRRRWRVELLRARGTWARQVVEVEWDHAARTLHRCAS